MAVVGPTLADLPASTAERVGERRWIDSIRDRYWNWPTGLAIGAATGLLALVVVVQRTYATGGRAAWSTALRVGSTECMREMGLVDVLAGRPCPSIGAPRGFPFVLGGSEALAAAVVGGVTGVDSYSAGVPVSVAISVIGFAGGYLLCRQIGAGAISSLVATTAYAVMPFTLGIQIFLGTGSGFILLPAYLLVELSVVRWLIGTTWSVRGAALARRLLVVGGYLLVQLWAVFLDGYTFLMSAVAGAGILVAYLVFRRVPARRVLAAGAVIVAVNALAVGLYLRAAHGVPVEAGTTELYRGWGGDLVTLLKPSNHWRWAAELGADGPRTDLFGDYTSSAWNYFGAVLAVLAVLGAVSAVRRRNVAGIAMAAIGVVAMVLSLGPALKLNAAVPAELLALGGTGRLQPPGQAGAVELPWGFVFDLPGLSGIRYPYRWSVLARVAAFALAALGVTRLLARRSWWAVAGWCLLVLLIVEQWPARAPFESLHARADAVAAGLRDDIVPDLERVTEPGMRVVFVDGTRVANEYLANPLAALAGVESFNLGGDKNYAWARAEWPEPVWNLISLPSGVVEIDDVVGALENGADAVVFLDIDLVASIDSWPTASNAEAFEAALEEARSRDDLVVTESGSVVAVTLADP